MRRAAAILVLAALVATFALGCGGGDGRAADKRTLRLGLVANTIGYGTAMGREQDLIVRAGAPWMREEILWSVVEPRRGARRWAAFDRMFAAAAARGLRVLPLLSDTPSWARRPNGGLPIRTEAYGAYVRDAVARYGVGGTFWKAHPQYDAGLAPVWFELWNEPYLTGKEVDDQTSATRYAALFRAGVEGGRAANRDARFLLALDTSAAGHPGVPERWMGRLLAADPRLLTRADGIAAHPYNISLGFGENALDELQTALDAHGAGRLPIWVTEIGWSTCTIHGGCVTEKRQAVDLASFLELVRVRYPRVSAVFVYRLRDLVVKPAFDREGSFGLIHVDGARKPAWAAFHRFALKLKGG
jgi:polysaccharide biosynthesis protein PslG